MKKVYIILLNYNGWLDTQECLESVLKLDYPKYQVVVVDNNSPNKSMNHLLDWAKGREPSSVNNPNLSHLSNPSIAKPVEFVFYDKQTALQSRDTEQESTFKNPIVFIQAGENRGFAGGNNIGIKYALAKEDFEYIWLLNNDTVIEKNSLSSLVTYANKNQLGISGSSLMYYDNPKKIQAYGGHVNKIFGTCTHILNIKEIQNKLDYVVGASFLIDKKVIDKIGLLPEEYFLYYEETDYCFNARNNRFKLGIDIKSIVYHKEGVSTGGSYNGNEKSEFSDILSIKNRMKFHRKYLGGRLGLYIGLFITILNRIKRKQFKRIVKILFKK
jgi:GT2 family glycosyltransferase